MTYAVVSFAEVELAVRHDLLANDIEAGSEVTTPALGQVHALSAGNVAAASEITVPVFADASKPP